MQRPVHHRQGLQIQIHIDIGGAGHLHQMSEQSKTGDIRAGGGAIAMQTQTRGIIRVQHVADRRIDPTSFRLVAHICGEQCACTERFGQQQQISCLHAALSQQMFSIDQAGDREAERELCAFAGMTADQRGIAMLQDFQRS